MVKYRVLVKIDEQNQFWIVVDKGKFIRYPTKEELKGTNLRSYSDTNICPIYREENVTDKSILYPGNACHGLNENNENTNDWICASHRRRNRERYDPNSRNNIIKSMADCRLDKVTYNPKILGEKSEKLTEIWTGAKKLSEKYDKYSMMPLDHDPIAKHLIVMIEDKLIDLYGNVVQTKAASFNSLTEKWDQDFKVEHDKEFDILILYCLSNCKMIERIYIFPRSEVIKRSHIAIYKKPTIRRYVEQWYENYRVKDNKILEDVNKIWCEINGTKFVYEEFIKIINDDNKESDGGYTKEDIIDMITQFIKENNRYPRTVDWIHNPKYPNFWEVTKIFGSWSIAIGKAKKYLMQKR